MKSYQVIWPIAGSWCCVVEAENEEDAAEKAADLYHLEPDAGELCWEFLKHITTGNVCHAPQGHLYVEEVAGDA